MTTKYHKRAESLATIHTEPTLTDQTGAAETEITTIVKRATMSGQVPGQRGEPQYHDWRTIPTSLVEMIKLARSAKEARKKLPEQLRNLTDAQLYALTREQLESLLDPKPATPPAEPPKPKEGT